MKVDVLSSRTLMTVDIKPGMLVTLVTPTKIRYSKVVRVVERKDGDVYAVFEDGTWRTTDTYNETWWKV